MTNYQLLASSILDTTDLGDIRIPLYDALEEEGWPIVWVGDHGYIKGVEGLNEYVLFCVPEGYADCWYYSISGPCPQCCTINSGYAPSDSTQQEVRQLCLEMFKQYLLTGVIK